MGTQSSTPIGRHLCSTQQSVDSNTMDDGDWLSARQRALIGYSWLHMDTEHKHTLFANAFLALILKLPSVKTVIFQLEAEGVPPTLSELIKTSTNISSTSSCLSRAIHSAVLLTHELIVVNELNQSQVQLRCWALGASHCWHIPADCDKHIWTAFENLLCESVSQCLCDTRQSNSTGGEHQELRRRSSRDQQLQYAWSMLIGYMIKTMSAAFDHHRLMTSL